METGQPEVLCQQVVGFHHEVAVIVAVDGNPRCLDVARAFAGEVVVHLVYREGIVERDGVEHGFQIVVSVRAFRHHVESKVDFCAGKYCHILLEFIHIGFNVIMQMYTLYLT